MLFKSHGRLKKLTGPQSLIKTAAIFTQFLSSLLERDSTNEWPPLATAVIEAKKQKIFREVENQGKQSLGRLEIQKCDIETRLRRT